MLYFNFKVFSRLTERAYKNTECPYKIEDVLSVFRYYFKKYEETFQEIHPPICLEQIETLINAMPYIDSDGSSSAGGDIEPEDYPALIDKHFKTQYGVGRGGCDYNINHFFSGDIRLFRFYEELY